MEEETGKPEFMYEIWCATNQSRQFTTKWNVAIEVRKNIHKSGMKCRIFKAKLVADVRAERMAKLMNLAIRAELAREQPPLFANSVIMHSDFDDEGQYAKENPFKEVDADIIEG